MDDLAGVPRTLEAPGVTYKNYDFKEGPGKEGSACISFVDGIPMYLNWYIWNLDHEWMMCQIETDLGMKIKLSNYTGGNGHCGADIEILKEENK